MRDAVAGGLRAVLEEAAEGDVAAFVMRLGLAGVMPALGWDDPRPPGERLWERLLLDAQLAVARRASAALTAAGVPHCLYKGMALQDAYAPGARHATDVDLLIGSGSVARALDALALGDVTVAPDAWSAAPDTMRRGLDLASRGGIPVYVDLAWALAGVNRLLSDPRHTDLTAVWESAHRVQGAPVPSVGVHLALVTHHLVHHDLRHPHGLVDAVLLWAALDDDEAQRAHQLARRLRIARVLAGLTCGFRERCGPLAPVVGGTHGVGDALDLVPLLRAATRGRAGDVITARRVWRRARLLDRRRDAWRLMRDIVAPPAAYLAWRWPDAGGYASRWFRHTARTFRKLIIDA